MSTTATPPPDLDSFTDTGLLHEIAGHRCVAGLSTDPATGRTDCLIEYLPPAVLTDPALLNSLIHQAMSGAEHPQWRDLVVRVPGAHPAPAPLTRDLSYLVLTPGAADGAALPPGIRIRPPAGPAEDALVNGWLRQAIAFGNRQREVTMSEEDVRATADACLSAPGRHSLLAVADGHGPIAHATLLTEAADPLHGDRYIDLVDILVADGHDRRSLTDALVAHAARHAAALGLPLIGNVVHARTPDADGTHVVDALTARGWRLRDTYWRCPLDAIATEPR
ncbi:hypothetical protein AB0D08_32865 [Kitasatospora sp. NPDC048540]|uniref:hypothetical protein n=1 Tax=unclassified Kitasatospora TaxID=2633591 RepID=UPI00053AA97A|nr:hypothetical protein [Kitasatospora sp. MBT63]